MRVERPDRPEARCTDRFSERAVFKCFRVCRGQIQRWADGYQTVTTAFAHSPDRECPFEEWDNPHLEKFLKRLLRAIDKAGLFHLIAAAAAVVLVFAGLYKIGAEFDWGIRSSNGSVNDFGSCLYFSVVTFTSLGYGDIFPVGWGRALACTEVVLGLSLFGVGVRGYAVQSLSTRVLSWPGRR